MKYVQETDYSAAPPTGEGAMLVPVRVDLSLTVGMTYRAKRPTKNAWGDYNDRTILWISENGERVQYDSIAVKDGRRYPTVERTAFLKWASHQITSD